MSEAMEILTHLLIRQIFYQFILTAKDLNRVYERKIRFHIHKVAYNSCKRVLRKRHGTL